MLRGEIDSDDVTRNSIPGPEDYELKNLVDRYIYHTHGVGYLEDPEQWISSRQMACLIEMIDFRSNMLLMGVGVTRA